MRRKFTFILAASMVTTWSAMAAPDEKFINLTVSNSASSRSETGEPGEFNGLNEQELVEYIGQKMAELGIEIVREEESELSVLSST